MDVCIVVNVFVDVWEILDVFVDVCLWLYL